MNLKDFSKLIGVNPSTISRALNNYPDISKKTKETISKIEEKEDDLVEIDIKEITEEENVSENLSKKLVKDFGQFDPTLELGNFKFPTLNLLKQYNESISIDPEELEANKNRIVETLKNYLQKNMEMGRYLQKFFVRYFL